MSERISKVTVDHDEIRRWAEARRGKPAIVRGTGIIRLDFPGFSGEGKLEPIAWDDWFERFEESNLALVFEEKTARGQKSNFNKLVGRETVDLKTGRSRGVPRRRAKQGARTMKEARRIQKTKTPKRAAKPTTARRTKASRTRPARSKRAGASRTRASSR